MSAPNLHSPYGPSSAARWIACPGSILACEGIPDSQSSYAAEGHVAHDLAEKALVENKACSEFIGILEGVDDEMAEYVQTYVDYVRNIGGHQEYEQMVHYDEWVPGGFGTSDAIVTVDDVIHVIDLKYGKGVQVYADDNPQGKLYALGALSERAPFQKFSKVVIHIVQPRLHHISTWETTPEELYQWADTLVDKYKTTLQPHAPRVAGDHCKFCKAKANCHALATTTESAIMMKFDEFASAPRELSSLTDEEMRLILIQKPMIIDWLKSVEAYVENRLKSGGTFPGFKMVHGRSNRRWADEADAEKELRELLGDNAYIRKILTITQAEKALGKEDKKKIQHLIVKPEGAPTLVTEDDKREALKTINENDFNF